MHSTINVHTDADQALVAKINVGEHTWVTIGEVTFFASLDQIETLTDSLVGEVCKARNEQMDAEPIPFLPTSLVDAEHKPLEEFTTRNASRIGAVSTPSSAISPDPLDAA